MNKILTILKKELKRYFTDIRMIIGMILPGILIFALYSVMGDMMTSNFEASKEYNIYVENMPNELSSMFELEGFTFTINEKNLNDEEIIMGIKNKEISGYVIFEDDFMNKVAIYDQLSGDKAPNVEIYYNSSDETSSQFYSYMTTSLQAFESVIANKFDINNSSNIYDLASKDDISVMLISMMLPFLLMTFLFSGAMGICSEAISGEKERGTIATLLITPVKRYHIVIGKIIALGITALTSATVSFIGLILSLPNLLGQNVSLSVYEPMTFVLLFLVIIVTVLIFTVALTMISTYAKSVKEASTLSVPVMIIVMLVGATGFMQTTAVTNELLYLIPIYNSLQCFRGLLSLTIDPACLLITIGVNLVVVGLGVFILSKMFNSEKIMFNK